MDDFKEHKILHEYNELIKEMVDWIKINNKRETYPIEAVAITYDGWNYSTSYMCFGWEERNPNVIDKSIWKWWSDETIISKIKFKNEAESMNSNKVYKIVQKTIFDLQRKIKEQKIEQKLREIEHDFE
jgi:hypothetical protein